MGIKTNKKFFDKFEYFLTKRKRVIGDVAKEILDNYYKKLDDEKRQFLIDLYEFSQTKKLSIKFKILMNKKLRSGNVKEDFKFRYDVLFNRM